MDIKAENTVLDLQKAAHAETVAEAYLSRLRACGIDYLYIGAGSDTAPIVEAYARRPDAASAFPKPVISAHETVAIGMAHGYTMVTGKMQAVMLHVSVGAANAVCGIINAARANVPILFTAGRSPIFEDGVLGARDSEIHWPQEMFDQGGMLRELVKWDYELRDARQMADVVDRAVSVALAHPRAPVYLTLPREVIAGPASHDDARRAIAPTATSAPAPDHAAVVALAKALMASEAPVFMCTGSGADPATVPMLVNLCERYGIGVGEARPRYVSFPDHHPLHMGHDQGYIYANADALVFLESDVPWVPSKAKPSDSAFVAHVGVDPLFARYPIRSHRSDLTIASSVSNLLPALAEALESLGAKEGAAVRKARLTALAQDRRQRVAGRIRVDEERGGPISKVYLAACLAKALPEDSILVNEYPLVRECLPFNQAGQFYSHPASGGLGWGYPAALGAQQAAPEKLVVACMGDGAYFFANPAACHHAAVLHDLPVVAVIFNNGGWGAVQNATLTVYPRSKDDAALQSNAALPLTSLDPLPDFEKYVEASGGIGIRITKRSELLDALRRAFDIARTERRQVLLNVIGQD